jgi:hypothetical protein
VQVLLVMAKTVGLSSSKREVFVIVVESSPNLLVSVVVCEALVDPMHTLPKLRKNGLACRLPSSSSPPPPPSAKAGLALARPSSRIKAKLRIENVKRDDFDRDIENPPENATL